MKSKARLFCGMVRIRSDRQKKFLDFLHGLPVARRTAHLRLDLIEHFSFHPCVSQETQLAFTESRDLPCCCKHKRDEEVSQILSPEYQEWRAPREEIDVSSSSALSPQCST